MSHIGPVSLAEDRVVRTYDAEAAERAVRDLLVAVGDDADRVALVVEGDEEFIELHAGDGEQGVDAVGLEGLDDGIAAGHASHAYLFPSIDGAIWGSFA